ncbi:hypothetical protein KBD34_02050 [Patescibacteria group bacterium]|nr:hypothetical protein [Patescibacteria group bacterium]
MAYSSERIQEVKSRLLEHKDLRAGEGEPIAVHAAVSKASTLYEKLRNAIDYRDEHLLRKGAIARILRRRLTLDRKTEDTALTLLRELVAAGYLPNAALPESLAQKVATIIGRYQAIRQCRTGSDSHYAWLYGVTVAELDELFDTNNERRSLSFFLYERLAESVILSKGEMDANERRLQIYIACIRSFQKADDDTLSLTLLRGYLPEWTTPEIWTAAPQDVAYRLVGVQALIKRQLGHPWSAKFLQTVRPQAVALRMLVETLIKDGGYDLERLDNPDKLEKGVAEMAEKQMSHARARLRRGTIRAIIYLFLTKVIFALALEIPFEALLYNHVDRTTLAINVALPPVLMMFLGSLIRLPGRQNTDRIVAMVKELLGSEPVPVLRMSIAKARSIPGQLLVSFAYLLMFLISFGAISYVLHRFHFTLVSALIFLFFLCVVSFFAFRLRTNAREVVVLRRPERFTTAVIDFFSYPILRAGHYLSTAVSKINVLILFFDVLIEAPFKLFLSALEHWLAFMRDRREEIE